VAWSLKREEKPVENPNEQKPPETSVTESKPVTAEDFKAMFAEAMAPVTQSVASLQEKFNAIEQAAKPREPSDQNLPTDFFDNPEKAFQERVTPIMLQQYQIQADMIEERLKAKFARQMGDEAYEEIAEPVETLLRDTPVLQKAQHVAAGRYDQFVMNVFKLVFGGKAMDAGVSLDGKTKKFFLGEGAGPSAEDVEAKKLESEFTPAQRKVFERMGVSLEDARKTMQRLEFVS
jgi:hypothetical protein